MAPVGREITETALGLVDGIPKMQQRTGKSLFMDFKGYSHGYRAVPERGGHGMRRCTIKTAVAILAKIAMK
ncbi:unnamed protein product [Cylicostephanus goldi]|uniref:Uncharacterized protein n=1 Tax=Cylicostephanus goldi TaxID=71465 RepID=A0A3P7QBZ4_CYLGO|nr:unnamed protein product [Cylicostephanus goldi]